MTQHDLDSRLRELSIFSNRPTVAGIPKGLFWAVCAICGLYTLLLTWWVGATVALIALPALYRAHRSDPAAFSVWMHALRERVDHIDPTSRVRLPITFEE